MITLNILGFILLLLLFILVLILFIPIEYSACGQRYENTFIEARISWLFKVFQIAIQKQSGAKLIFYIKIFGYTIKPKLSYKPKKKKKKKKHKNHFTKDLLGEILKAVRKLFEHIKPEIFQIEGAYGFDDPYYTGIACIVINNLPCQGEVFKVKMTPIFDNEILEGRFIIQGKVILAVIAWIALKVVLSSPVRNIFKNERKRKNYAN